MGMNSIGRLKPVEAWTGAPNDMEPDPQNLAVCVSLFVPNVDKGPHFGAPVPPSRPNNPLVTLAEAILLVLLRGGSAFVLLIACANLAKPFLLARSTLRRAAPKNLNSPNVVSRTGASPPGAKVDSPVCPHAKALSLVLPGGAIELLLAKMGPTPRPFFCGAARSHCRAPRKKLASTRHVAFFHGLAFFRFLPGILLFRPGWPAIKTLRRN